MSNVEWTGHFDSERRAINVGSDELGRGGAPAEGPRDAPATGDLLAEIDRRFVSGNAIPVERAHLRAAEWAVVRTALAAVLSGASGGVGASGAPPRPTREQLAKRFYEAFWDGREDVESGPAMLRVADLALTLLGEPQSGPAEPRPLVRPAGEQPVPSREVLADWLRELLRIVKAKTTLAYDDAPTVQGVESVLRLFAEAAEAQSAGPRRREEPRA